MDRSFRLSRPCLEKDPDKASEIENPTIAFIGNTGGVDKKLSVVAFFVAPSLALGNKCFS